MLVRFNVQYFLCSVWAPIRHICGPTRRSVSLTDSIFTPDLGALDLADVSSALRPASYISDCGRELDVNEALTTQVLM